MTPSMSVVMPMFNAGRYLLPAIESVLSDLGPDDDLVIVDDGSTDGSLDVARGVRHRRVTLISQPNGGLVSALQAGIRASRGQLIARMDADDLNVPGRLASARKVLEADQGVALVSCWADVIDGAGAVVGALQTPWLPDDAHLNLLFLGNNVVHGAAVFRRAVYDASGGYRDGVAEDYDLWLRIVRHGRLRIVPQRLYQYRRLESSLTGQRGAAVQAAARELTDAVWRVSKGPPAPPGRTARAHHRLYVTSGGPAAGELYCSNLIQLAGESRHRGQRLLAARFFTAAALACPRTVEDRVVRLVRSARGVRPGAAR